ncbi:MAG: SH3 domain-containing protein [Anaerolineaceae bacterium]|nr:SH3 domain-containing protein [Anaerolineaceae bacterium]
MTLLNKWRSSFIVMVILMTAAVGLTQTQAADVEWETRFNHSLGISFQLPKGYELEPSSSLIYTNGQSTIVFHALPNRSIHRIELDAACQGVSINSPGYDYEIVNGGKHAICLYTNRRNRESYTSIIAENRRRTSGGGRYDYLLVIAPSDDLLPLTESIIFEDSVSAVAYLDEALRTIHANFVYPDAVDWNTVYQTAMASVDQFSTLDDARQALKIVFGILNKVSAHPAQIFSPDDLNARGGYGFEEHQLAGDNFQTVTLVYPNSPADKQGIEVGDHIETINGIRAVDAPEPDGSKTIRLEVTRPGKFGTLNFRLVPNYYSTSLPVNGRRLTDQISYIETYSAGASGENLTYPNDAQQLIRKLDKSNTCGWIVDVRRNPGGQALVMSMALAPLRGNGRWFGLKNITGSVQWYDYQGNGFPSITKNSFVVSRPYTVQNSAPPVAVLTSPYTASMGEMTAYIFKSRTDAPTRIFGEATGGYLSDGLNIIRLFDGSVMDIVSALGIAPDGTPLPKNIQPDEVVLTDYSLYGTDDDPVIKAADAWLMSQPQCQSQQSPQNLTQNQPGIQTGQEIRLVATSAGIVNIRSGPGTDYDIVLKLANGTRLEVIDRSADGTWLNVRFEGGEGWISASLTRTANSSTN